MSKELTKTFGSHLINLAKIPDNGMFIDAGACQGNFIDEIQKHVKNPFILAVEPNKTNADFLREINYDQVIVIEAALVASHEPKKMMFDDFNVGGLPEWGNVTGMYSNRPHTSYEVETMDIRELLALVPDNIIHHLKMDIEGCEHGVVADLTTTDAKRIQQITMEVHNGLQSLMEKLTALGYNFEYTNGELYAIRKEL